jgi:hypothetical protein
MVMLIFGSLTILHVQQSTRRVLYQKTGDQTQTEPPRLPQEQLQRQKTTDRQLIQMMIVQCIYFSLTSSPAGIFWIYSSWKLM